MMLKVFVPALLCAVFSANVLASNPTAELVGMPLNIAQQELVAMGYAESESYDGASVFVLHTSKSDPMMQDKVFLRTLGDKKVSEVFFNSTQSMPYSACMNMKASSDIKVSCQKDNVASIYAKF